MDKKDLSKVNSSYLRAKIIQADLERKRMDDERHTLMCFTVFLKASKCSESVLGSQVVFFGLLWSFR